MGTAFEFNKELILGEIGAWISAPSLAFIVSLFTTSASLISYSAAIGALIGASVFWLVTRIFHYKRRDEFSLKGMAEDITFFTPVALVCGVVLYYPSVYLVSNHLILSGDKVIYSVIASQIVAFTLFLIAINIYRQILQKSVGKKL